MKRSHRARRKQGVYGYPPEVAAQSGHSSKPDKAIIMVLPLDARPYRRTDTFTEVTVPAALLKAHTTKQGTWALIHVLEGRLVYKIVEPGRPSSHEVLTPTTPPGVIEPAILHEVAPLGPVRFYVEFYRLGEDRIRPAMTGRSAASISGPIGA